MFVIASVRAPLSRASRIAAIVSRDLAGLRDPDHERVLAPAPGCGSATRSRCRARRGRGPTPRSRSGRRRPRGTAVPQARITIRRRLRSSIVGHAQLLEHERARDERGRRASRDGLGLLVDLLEHEGLVAALLGGLDRPSRPRTSRSSCAVLDRDEAGAVGRDRDDLAVLDQLDRLRLVDERGGHRGRGTSRRSPTPTSSGHLEPRRRRARPGGRGG